MEPLFNGHFGTRPFLLQYRGFPLSEVNNVLVTPVRTKIFVLVMAVILLCPLIGGFVKRGSAVVTQVY